MEQSPSWRKHTSLSAGEEMNENVPYQVHKGPPMVPLLNQMYPVHSLPPYFLKINFNIVFQSVSRSSMLFLSYSVFHKTLYSCLFSTKQATFNSHPFILDFITQILFCEKDLSWINQTFVRNVKWNKMKIVVNRPVGIKI